MIVPISFYGPQKSFFYRTLCIVKDEGSILKKIYWRLEIWKSFLKMWRTRRVNLAEWAGSPHIHVIQSNCLYFTNYHWGWSRRLKITTAIALENHIKLQLCRWHVLIDFRLSCFWCLLLQLWVVTTTMSMTIRMSSWKNWHTVWPNIIFIAIIMKLPANILNGCRYMAKNIEVSRFNTSTSIGSLKNIICFII